MKGGIKYALRILSDGNIPKNKIIEVIDRL